MLARARERAEDRNKPSTSKPTSVQGRQRPAIQNFNEGAKQHTLAVEPSDFEGYESDGKHRFPGNTSRSLLY